MNKEEWAEAWIAGDDTALLQRIELDKLQLYGIAYSYMRNEVDALEAIQETVCRIWTKRRTLKEPHFFYNLVHSDSDSRLYGYEKEKDERTSD